MADQTTIKSWFVIATLGVYLLLGLVSSPMIHPYFRDPAFCAVELPLTAALLVFSAGRLQSARTYILLMAMCGAGYLIGAMSYLIKWAFFDHVASTRDHLAQIGQSLLSENLWVTAIFTYGWVFLPLSVVAGRWTANWIKGKAAFGKG